MTNNSNKPSGPGCAQFSGGAGEEGPQGTDSQHIESIAWEKDLGDFVVWLLAAGPGVPQAYCAHRHGCGELSRGRSLGTVSDFSIESKELVILLNYQHDIIGNFSYV